MHHQIVEFDGINPIIPKCIPKKRERRDIFDKALLGTCLLGVGAYVFPPYQIGFLLSPVINNSCLLIISELCSRMCCLREEFAHLESRYEGSVWKLLKKTFSFNEKTKYFAIVASISAVVSYSKNIPMLISSTSVITSMFCFIGVKLITDLLEMDESKLKTAKIIDKFPIDYGTGMAFSFFYGYLEFMLPPTGDEKKGLKEQIVDYADDKGVEFGSYKLYILLPLSAKCPHNIEEYSPFNIVKRAGNLDWIKKDVAGIEGREYHNTVYKLYYNGENQMPIHVCAEFATPLKTYYDVINYNHEETNIFKEYRREIVAKFFITLQKIINDKGYNRYVELILFEDMDENGQCLYEDRLDMGELLLQKINNPLYAYRQQL